MVHIRATVAFVFVAVCLVATPFSSPARAEQPSIERLSRDAKAGDKEAMYRLGLRYLNGDGVPQDAAKALVWFRSTVYGPKISGYAPAEYELGKASEAGNGVERNLAQAFAWDSLAAINDPQYGPVVESLAARLTPEARAEGRYELALKIADGIGAPQDHLRAVQLFRQAAEPGFREAQHMLGFMYGRGLGVDKDVNEAARWYRLAAEQDYWTAQHNLGALYEKGEGVPQDLVEAWKWHFLSARSETYNTPNYIRVGKLMAPEQIEAAKARVAAWQPVSPIRTFSR